MKIILDSGAEIHVPQYMHQSIIDHIFAQEKPKNFLDSVVTKTANKKPVENKVKVENTSTARRSFTEAEKENIIEMKKRSFSSKEIAKKMQCKPEKIDQFLHIARRDGLLPASNISDQNNNSDNL